MLRKRKTSTEESGQEAPDRENLAQNHYSGGDKDHHKVVHLSNVIWLLLGLVIGVFNC